MVHDAKQIISILDDALNLFLQDLLYYNGNKHTGSKLGYCLFDLIPLRRVIT